MKDTATTNPTIRDELLKRFANPSAQEQLGEFDDVTCAMLAVALPEICSELLNRRQLDAARSFLFSSSGTNVHDLTAACETILQHSGDASDRAAAQQVLGALQEAA
ncbi:hypothetical protein J4729_18840 [Leisingera sp. HS039]|uniref:hypothetical protein n=1 Tax=Leisingera sp. HS039 TaxID=2818496 RepID=UPI001B39FF19|nr:hypothetical protein [Leisingera sp. HS039]MBQ4826585.1 hypothetical protein [Leisingera sp. HS039]